MICTNVPGPPMPLYLLGHKLMRCYPYVPIGGELGVNVAILSYNGVAYVGFGGDVTAVPDIELFETMLRESFGELRQAAATTVATSQTPETISRKPRPKPIPTAIAKQVRLKPAIKKIPVRVKPKANGTATTSVPSGKDKSASAVRELVPALAHAGD
jgi:hypothetical protein